jgi:hypothetical protein
MIQLFKNGKLVDFGTKKHVGMYVKMGYDVKVLNDWEAEQFFNRRKLKAVWKDLPTVLKKRIAAILRCISLSWKEKYDSVMLVLKTIMERARRIHLVPKAERC